jgi:ATP-dependent helicase/nuclease subunit A
VLRSEIWQRGRRAKRALYEVSMTVSKLPEEILSGGLASGSAGADTETAAAGTQASLNRLIVKGVVDYVFEEEDGWVIVDFKTDQLEENNLESFLQFYRPQVLAYAREWEKTFGYKVKGAGLLFTSLPKYVVLV